MKRVVKVVLDGDEMEMVGNEAKEAGMGAEEYGHECVVRYGWLKRFAEAAARDHGEMVDLVDDAMVELRRLARPGAFGEGAMPFLQAMERLARRMGREPILKVEEV